MGRGPTCRHEEVLITSRCWQNEGESVNFLSSCQLVAHAAAWPVGRPRQVSPLPHFIILFIVKQVVHWPCTEKPGVKYQLGSSNE